MDARAIIETLRDGGEPTQAQMTWFANGLATGAVTDAQAGAFAMAVCLRGLSEEARVALTLAMRDSGDVLEWKLKTPVVDKHSTGGIGDCVSLLLAPMLAAVGVANPMISGRGLGHTGGTLDKLEAIPGVSTDVDETTFRRMVDDIGCAIVSASKRIAPADKRLYAVRDVTGTVESIDLITASILSKKLAAGLGSLILDVKCGSGAFMKTRDDAVALARSLVSTANGAGCRTAALVTAMDQPLASTAGNALEVAEVMQALTAPRNSRLVDLTLALGAELMLLAKVDVSPEVAAGKLLDTLKSGRAAEKFDAMIEALGGPARFSEDWQSRLPEANVIREIAAPQSGKIAALDGHAIGLAVVRLGGGRLREGDRIDPSVGFSDILPLGAEVSKGEPVARLHAAGEKAAQEAERAYLDALTIGERAEPLPLMIERVG
ncbi:thymidine phosphorylase [Silicimonas algicola]|uniref:Thymidine phosphorylase n=1 Tax=Silicimonas algicola TaxID=1826607 RepID=A0A316G7J9_9RHOB|nr:thymidine phosphorylase [Silicimonas algicola]AZQ68757.1 thymidine phosphorylase [Silicimonas algicola]PWK56165.1 thymidine phosphorylase [Silicimonas algicola]